MQLVFAGKEVATKAYLETEVEEVGCRTRRVGVNSNKPAKKSQKFMKAIQVTKRK
jgi:hypothetical protein